jgi:hypothetical protein
MTLNRAVEIVLSCQTKYRLPEPIRLVHHWINEARRAASLPVRPIKNKTSFYLFDLILLAAGIAAVHSFSL